MSNFRAGEKVSIPEFMMKPGDVPQRKMGTVKDALVSSQTGEVVYYYIEIQDPALQGGIFLIAPSNVVPYIELSI